MNDSMSTNTELRLGSSPQRAPQPAESRDAMSPERITTNTTYEYRLPEPEVMGYGLDQYLVGKVTVSFRDDHDGEPIFIDVTAFGPVVTKAGKARANSGAYGRYVKPEYTERFLLDAARRFTHDTGTMLNRLPPGLAYVLTQERPAPVIGVPHDLAVANDWHNEPRGDMPYDQAEQAAEASWTP